MASGLRARASEARAIQVELEGREEQEKGDQQRFPLSSSSSSKLLRFFSKSDSSLYWYKIFLTVILVYV